MRPTKAKTQMMTKKASKDEKEINIQYGVYVERTIMCNKQ